LGFSSGTSATKVAGTANLNAGTWYLLIAWHDPAANTINLQINNGTVFSKAFSAGIQNSTYPLRLGTTSGSPYGYVDGVIDEAFIYRRVLTADEREWLYNSGNGRTYSELSQIDNAYLMNWW
jgi:hypothetical protein